MLKVETFQRDTQTVTLRNKYQQVMFDAATQMVRLLLLWVTMHYHGDMITDKDWLHGE